MQSNQNNFGDDVFLVSMNRAYRNEDSILDQIYENPICMSSLLYSAFILYFIFMIEILSSSLDAMFVLYMKTSPQDCSDLIASQCTALIKAKKK